MGPNLCHFVSIGLAAASIAGLAGCATQDVPPKLRVYGGIILPPDAQAIGLTVSRRCTEFTLQPPETKAGGARSAAAAGAREAASDPYGALLFPVGYVMGGMMGGLFGVSEGELKDATRSIETATRMLRFDERLVTTLMEHVSILLPGRIQSLRDDVPMERPGAHGYTARGPDGKLTWTRSSPASHPLLGTGIDTVIGVRVGFQGFQPRMNPHVRSTGDAMGFNPPLALVLIADVTVMRVRDWVEIGGLTIHYESAPLKFTEWAAGDAQPLRLEMETAMREVLSQIRPLVVCKSPSRTSSFSPSSTKVTHGARCCAGVCAAAHSAASPPAPPDAIDFEANTSFTTQALREGLAGFPAGRAPRRTALRIPPRSATGLGSRPPALSLRLPLAPAPS